MAHDCPECGQLCFCGGDIDDCNNNFPQDQAHCTHYLTCGDEQEDDECDCYECSDKKIV